MSLIDAFQERLRELGWSRYKLAKQSGLPNNTVHRMFKGSASRRSFRKAAEALGLNVNEVTGGQEDHWVYTERQSLSLTQAQLARAAGISPSYVSGIEKGLFTPTPGVIHKLKTAFEFLRERKEKGIS